MKILVLNLYRGQPACVIAPRFQVVEPLDAIEDIPMSLFPALIDFAFDMLSLGHPEDIFYTACHGGCHIWLMPLWARGGDIGEPDLIRCIRRKQAL
ncbi:hypothetical protein [Chromobacterium sphagni]|uniref:hypothetical protein n=1 Tax=Chromobacterium sphagni TaxID=1903179 RepID=UPI001F4EB386|nr:hypothetical protein [Chromobacterium sphagni]